MRNLLIIGLVLLMFGCSNTSKDGYITVKVLEVEQVGAYTYLLVKDKGQEYWVAVNTMVAQPGEMYKYTDGLVMEDFYSAQLDRTFEKVIFINEILPANSSKSKNTKMLTPGSTVEKEKADVVIEVGEGTVSIAELYANPKDYSGKVIQVKGEVTKYNAAIMDRNWVHLQDGTEHKGKFDLTITTGETFEVGSVVVIEGTVALEQDFGYGYNYEILLENATVVK